MSPGDLPGPGLVPYQGGRRLECPRSRAEYDGSALAVLWNALSAPGCGNQGLEGFLRLGRFGAGYRRYPMPDSGRLFFGLGKMPYNKSTRVTGRRQPDMNL